MATSPWNIDRQRGTQYNQTPSSRVTYYDQPRSTVPRSQYKSASERLGQMEPGAANWFPEKIDWRSAWSRTQPPSYPQMPTIAGGGGSGYGGGGGGGGGATGLTPEQQAAMARLFGPQLMQFTPFDAPDYQAFTPTARDTAMYDTARQRIGSARDADVAFAQDQGRQLMQLLGSQQNVMANPRMTATPQMQQAYQRIVGGAPGNQMVADVINAENAYSQNSDNAFQNLMAVLATQEGRNMQSRQREATQDQSAILNAIRAQASGMLGGVDMADLQDAKEYQRYLNDVALGEHRYGADRDYQTAYGNWQGQLGVDQGNVGIQNDWAQMLMDLIPMLTDSSVLSQIGARTPAINTGATVSAGATRG